MKNNKKNIMHFCAIVSALFVGTSSSAKSIGYYTNKAKGGITSVWDTTKAGVDSAWHSTQKGLKKAGDRASSTYNKAYASWSDIDPSTKKQIQAVLISLGAVAGKAAIGAGKSYLLDTPEAGGDRGDTASYQLTHDQDTFDQLIGFLRSDENYAGNLENQAGFLDRFPGLTDGERLNILDIVNDPRVEI